MTGYIDSTAYYDTFSNTLPIQSSSQILSYIESPDIMIHFHNRSHIVITRVSCIMHAAENDVIFFHCVTPDANIPIENVITN